MNFIEVFVDCALEEAEKRDPKGLYAKARAGEILEGLGIPTEVHRQPLSTLSGGFKLRVLLAQVLSADPDVLLLDEPTNHLDLDSIHWLVDFLRRYEGTLIVISHDRHFLNAVCTHIADIDYQTIITYTGGYDDMVLAKTQIRSRIESDNAWDRTLAEAGEDGSVRPETALKAAQARGDFDVLTRRGRRALRVHLKGDLQSGLSRLDEAISRALM